MLWFGLVGITGTGRVNMISVVSVFMGNCQWLFKLLVICGYRVTLTKAHVYLEWNHPLGIHSLKLMYIYIEFIHFEYTHYCSCISTVKSSTWNTLTTVHVYLQRNHTLGIHSLMLMYIYSEWIHTYTIHGSFLIISVYKSSMNWW